MLRNQTRMPPVSMISIADLQTPQKKVSLFSLFGQHGESVSQTVFPEGPHSSRSDWFKDQS